METPNNPSVKYYDLTQFRLEPHVRKAFRMAWRLSGGQPINASHLIDSVVLLHKEVPSSAFKQLVTILDVTVYTGPILANVSPADLSAMPFPGAMVESLANLRRVIGNEKSLWGRDLITLALLASKDPSHDTISNNYKPIREIQDQWFEFVTASQQRRGKDSWIKWWQLAGIPVPGSEKTVPDKLPSYLLTWNPNEFIWDELEENIKTIEDIGSASGRWSTGMRKNVVIGARVYLLRQGQEPRGLVGKGIVASEVFEDDDWNKSRKTGKTNYAKITWLALSSEPVVLQEDLPKHPSNDRFWLPQAGGIKIDPILADEVERIWEEEWIQRADGLPNLKPHHWIASFNADTGSHEDQLQISRYVNAFARVISSRNLKPPLSIGLFGDWGSGKTFFITSLEEKIKEICESDSNGSSPLYWKQICQIKFNAWHYAETNLWASLVSTIFSELRLYLDGDKEDADEFNQLMNQLEVAERLRKEAEKNLRKARESLKKAERDLQSAQDTLGKKSVMPEPSDEEVRRILKQSFSEVFKGRTGQLSELLRAAGERTGRPELIEIAQNIEEGKTTVEEARILMDETESLAKKASFWWRILSSAKIHKSKYFWPVVIALLAIPAIGIVLNEIVFPEDNWPHVWAVILEVITGTSAVIGWLRTQLASAGGVFDKLNAVQKAIERRIEEAHDVDQEKYVTDRNRALENEKKAKEDVEKAKHNHMEAVRAEEQAAEAVRESTSEARLNRYIRQRASDADYTKHLGLIAMVHRDFQKLSELILKMQGKDPISESGRVDRIVLYIDDLDRCHPEKVVQVLEAIHLLLFFPLFVVVVGVDSRWISRALFKQYDGMLVDEAMIEDETRNRLEHAPADSHNYLEKIFQVPFWLRRMDSSSVTRLIHSLISDEEIEYVPKPEVRARPVGLPHIEQDEDVETKEQASSFSKAKIISVEAESHLDVFGDELAPPSEGLTITDIELDYMDQIAPLMPRTPRSIKRFVNIYRLYKASLSTPALARFLGTPQKPGNYQAVQILLALVTGEPRLAQTIYIEMMDESRADDKLSDLWDVLNKGDHLWKPTLDALQKFAQGRNDIKLSDLQEVSPLVGRYSLHHMVSRSPGQTVFS